MNILSLKHRICAALFVLLAVFAINSTGWAATYYVSATGNNANPGTLSQPWKTIQKFLDTCVAGDICYLRNGTYSSSTNGESFPLVIKHLGTSGNPITIKNYSTETATLNAGNSNVFGSSSTPWINTEYWYVIDGSNGMGAGTYGLRLISNGDGGGYNGVGGSTILLERGYSETATDNGIHRFTINACYIQGSIRMQGNNNHITNCEINGNYNPPGTGYIRNTVAMYYGCSHHCTISNNKIYNFLSRGIHLMSAASYVTISGNRIYNSAATGRELWGINLDGAGVPGHYNSVLNNEIGPFIQAVGWNTGITLENAFDSRIDGNYIHDIVGSATGIYIRNYGSDYSGIESRDKNTNTVVSNNIIVNSGDSLINIESANDYHFLNNTFVSSSGSHGIYIQNSVDTPYYYPKYLEIRNNIFGSAFNGALQMVNSSSLTGSIFSNNLFYSANNTHKVGSTTYTLSSFQATGRESGSKSGSAQFVGANDFHLQAGSPAIDAGYPVSLTIDFDDKARPQGASFDIGAYEFGSSSTPSPPKGFKLVY